MKVRALRLGYYNLKRRKPGEVFEMDDNAYFVKGKDGKPVMRLDKEGKSTQEPVTCSWVETLGGKPAKGKRKDEDNEIPPEVSANDDVI